MNFLSFFQDNSGGLSATRLGFLLWVVGVLVVWVFHSFGRTDHTLAEIPNSVVTVLGILMTGKAVQRFGEKSDGNDGQGSSNNKSPVANIPPA